ncbi:MAG: DegT/DnrJ/EryC1/StrS family aminotransferase [Acidobacteriota bacterium]
MNHPAILGNTPIFTDKIHIVRPDLPAFSDLAADAQDILANGMVTKGKYLRAFEEAVAEHLGARHAIAVSSCTTGLMLTYRCLNLTGEAVVPSFTFMATVSALIWAGLRPVYADVDFDTTNLNVAAAEAAITPETTAIVAVHNFGNPADIDELQALADSRDLKLIFDAAHGFGALYRGKPVGAEGNAQVYSLSPTKLVIAGEGGIVATNDDELAEKIRWGREYGNSGNYDSAFAGINARMPEFNALMGLHSLRRLETGARRRNELVELYREQLGALPGVGFQTVRPGNRHSYKDFSITIDPQAFGMNRDELAAALAAENIDSRKYYEPPVHRQTAYAQFATNQTVLDNTETLSGQSLSLPIWSNMDATTALKISHAVQRIQDFAGEVKQAIHQSTNRQAR